MLLCAANKPKRLLLLSYSGHVRAGELDRWLPEVRAQLAELPRGFRILADFSHLASMEVGCTPELGRLMELLDQAGVARVARVMPDAKKDVGMNILTLFHYRHPPQVTTCRTLAEAAQTLGL